MEMLLLIKNYTGQCQKSSQCGHTTYSRQVVSPTYTGAGGFCFKDMKGVFPGSGCKGGI